MNAIIRTEKLSLPMSRLGEPSNLPRFRWQQPMPNRETPPNFGLSPEESSHGFEWGEDSILPYQVSDDYDRDLRDGELDVLVIENSRLRAVVAPSLGGRLLELKDLASGRDLVFRNPVFQPANLAALNAWFSGGIEWNGLIPGHTAFTCAPVFAGVRNTPQGPILRLYEFDRIVEATWQVDLFLPTDSAVLYAHGRIVNPAAEMRLAYWWTNVAAPMQPGTRVLSPADYSIEHIWPGNNLGRCEFPRADWDASYPEHWENATSVFFRAPEAPRLFIASVDRDGHGLLQTATHEMQGRKFFYFGSAIGGQNWMDYLSQPGKGNYLEIQSGVAPTQNQRFELAPGEQREWTEAYMPTSLDAGQAHAADYRAATAHAGRELDALLPADELARIDAFLREQARLPLDVRHSSGTSWGVRQERLLGRKLAEGLDFSVDGAAGFWDELAGGGTVSAANLTDMPSGTAVSAVWVDRLAASANAQGETWLHALMLATAALDRDDRDAARRHVAQSLSLRPNWAAYRLEALLADTPEVASQSYLRAWSAEGAPPELAIEIAQHFMAARRSAELKAFVDALPAAVRDKERIILARAVVAADDGDFDELERLLFSRSFASIREGETLLSDLWVRLRRGRLDAGLKRAASADEIKADLKAHPVPRELNLRMHEIET
ncbi:MAG: DUF5107 domain-containing protein [Devosia sp.]|uniref:DUF5107 domain-containing protein n=1 Tax=Devosia sp. 66-22 TaxID=1895753 RepID=UPI00092ADA41|nr:DUF5107 domain-containing protein [Devosia sp. 66-22]MBN9348176.1 DUF5107 domain-containing protein [Devosia sp.]OJX51394.1 MAG: hypothetical protein BGO81_12020 [Devosia sp. 66-22]